MYRKVLADLATERGWAVHLYDAKSVEEEARNMLGAGAANGLDSPRATLGPPWSKDHRLAFAAALLAS
jgi:hypothetical protein